MSDFEIRVACSIGIAFGSRRDRRSRRPDPPRPVRGEAVEDLGPCRALPDPRVRRRARSSSGSRPSCAARSSSGALRLTYQPICDLATGPGRRVRIARALDRRERAGIFAQRFHPGRRGIGADRPARPLGDRRGGEDVARVGRQGGRRVRGQVRGQPVGDPAAPRRHRAGGRKRADGAQAGGQPLHARADRKRARRRSGARRRTRCTRSSSSARRSRWTISARAIRTSPISRNCRSTCSRSTAAS